MKNQNEICTLLDEVQAAKQHLISIQTMIDVAFSELEGIEEKIKGESGMYGGVQCIGITYPANTILDVKPIIDADSIQQQKEDALWSGC